MLKYFQKDALGQYITLIIILIAIRLPLIIYGVPLTLPEVKWLSFSDALSSGGIPYQNFWDETSPLTALIHWIMYSIFGKQIVWYHIMSTILIGFQAFRWNRILYKHKVYNERTMLPALFYILFANMFFDCLLLSPVLIATTFILFACAHIFAHLNENTTNNSMFDIGLYIGLAALSYAPTFLFALVPIIGFVVFTGTKLRNYVLFVFSFLAPILILYFIFLFLGADYYFVTNVFGSLFSVPILYFINVRSLLTVIFIPIVSLGFSIFRILQLRKYSNYQVRCQQLMVIASIIFVVMFLFFKELSVYSFMIFLPLFSFFFTHVYLDIKKPLFSNLLLILQVVLVLMTLYTPLWLKTPPKLAKYDKFRISTDLLLADKVSQKKQEALQGKKVLILGNNLTEYYWSTPTTPYFNWRLAQNDFYHLNKYNVDVDIFQNFEKNPPDLIIDKKDFAKILFERIPILKKRYVYDKEYQWYKSRNSKL